jgi:hypothetical protein
MAMQDIPGGFWYPCPLTERQLRGHTALSAGAIGSEVAFVVDIAKTGNISKVAFRTGSVSTAGDGDVRIEGVSTVDGEQNGTLIDVNATGAFSLLASDDNIWKTVDLDGDVAVTKGQVVAVVLVSDPTTGYTGSAYSYTSNNTWQHSRPYIVNSSGSKISGAPAMGIEYDDGSYGYILGATTNTLWEKATYAADSTPDENALKFKLPYKARITGIWCESEIDGTNNGFTIRFYDSDGSTVLTSLLVDKDTRFSATNIANTYYKFAASQTVEADTFYYISFFPTNNAASGTISIGFDEWDSAALMDGMNGGQNFHRAFQTNGGGWTADTNARMRVSIHIDQVDVTPADGPAFNPASQIGARTGGMQ